MYKKLLLIMTTFLLSGCILGSAVNDLKSKIRSKSIIMDDTEVLKYPNEGHVIVTTENETFKNNKGNSISYAFESENKNKTINRYLFVSTSFSLSGSGNTLVIPIPLLKGYKLFNLSVRDKFVVKLGNDKALCSKERPFVVTTKYSDYKRDANGQLIEESSGRAEQNHFEEVITVIPMLSSTKVQVSCFEYSYPFGRW